jgi:hypothetical protein
MLGHATAYARRSDGTDRPLCWAFTASTSQAKTLRRCRRQVSITVSNRSTKRLPDADGVPNDSGCGSVSVRAWPKRRHSVGTHGTIFWHCSGAIKSRSVCHGRAVRRVSVWTWAWPRPAWHVGAWWKAVWRNWWASCRHICSERVSLRVRQRVPSTDRSVSSTQHIARSIRGSAASAPE